MLAKLDSLSGLNPENLPARLDRASSAVLVSHHFFPVSSRTLERWPLAVRRINGKALIDTRELIAVAKAKIDSAPPVACGPAKRTR